MRSRPPLKVRMQAQQQTAHHKFDAPKASLPAACLQQSEYPAGAERPRRSNDAAADTVESPLKHGTIRSYSGKASEYSRQAMLLKGHIHRKRRVAPMANGETAPSCEERRKRANLPKRLSGSPAASASQGRIFRSSGPKVPELTKFLSNHCANSSSRSMSTVGCVLGATK